MTTRTRAMMDSLNKKKEDGSQGIICPECIKDAYYFNIKAAGNTLYRPRLCLACDNETEKGILIENIVDTLLRHLSKHYHPVTQVAENEATFTLIDILKRFTLNNENALNKISENLILATKSKFNHQYKYKHLVDDDFISKCIEEQNKIWDKYANELKHKNRFTHVEAVDYYKNIIGSCYERDDQLTPTTCLAMKTVSASKVLYRARRVQDDNHQKNLMNEPGKEFSAPPEKRATNSRMSPPGISFLYTAEDEMTCIAEVHPYAGDKIAVAAFTTTRDLNFFDFTAVGNIKPSKPNILTDPNNKYYRQRYILSHLHDLIAKPFRATDTSYIEMQILAEVIRNYESNGIHFDGIIFKSTQCESGLNYVIFGDHAVNDGYNNIEKKYGVKLCDTQKVHFYHIDNVALKTTPITD